MKRTFIIMIAVLLVFAMSGCVTLSKTPAAGGAAGIIRIDADKAEIAQQKKEAAEAKAIVKVIKAQLKALEQEDVDAVLSTMHQELAANDDVVCELEALFEITEDLSYDLVDYKYFGAGIMDITQETCGKDSTRFRDNRISATWVFQQVEGEWKFSNSTVHTTTYLNAEVARR